jgi:ADP-ribose pyrophosphatase YjhB (NUDIX family)
MKLLASHTHESIKEIKGIVEKRQAARGIIIKNNKILLMYTRRYNDYSLPGGGVATGEDILEGLSRELAEETGARNISVVKDFGVYEEFRPALKPTYDILHMVSFIYEVDCDDQFDAPAFEDYELKNGMQTLWMDIDEAISHNQQVINAMEASMGLSIKRELFLLQQIRAAYFSNATFSS